MHKFFKTLIYKLLHLYLYTSFGYFANNVYLSSSFIIYSFFCWNKRKLKELSHVFIKVVCIHFANVSENKIEKKIVRRKESSVMKLINEMVIEINQKEMLKMWFMMKNRIKRTDNRETERTVVVANMKQHISLKVETAQNTFDTI